MKRAEIWHSLWFASLAICPALMGLLALLCHEPRDTLADPKRPTPWAYTAITILIYSHWLLSLVAAIAVPRLTRGWGERLLAWVGVALWLWMVNALAFLAALSVNAMTG